MNKRTKELARRIESLVTQYPAIGGGMFKTIAILDGEKKALRKASDEMLGMFIDEIQVLTPEKLKVIRKVKRILGG